MQTPAPLRVASSEPSKGTPCGEVQPFLWTYTRLQAERLDKPLAIKLKEMVPKGTA